MTADKHRYPQHESCGTYGGYQRHLKRGEPTCVACKEARALWQQKYRDANPTARLRERDQTVAYGRAQARLRELHREEFDRLYDEELGRVRR